MRFFLMISILAATLQADAVTVIETKSGTGLNQLFYNFDVPASPGPVTAGIQGSANCFGGCGDQYTTVSIDLTMDLYTTGPVRDGVALLQLVVGSSGTASGAAHASGTVGPYSKGNCFKDLTCTLSGFFPFELGVPFTINLSGYSDANPAFVGGAGFSASSYLQLYELPTQEGDRFGAPVQINLVPEPGSAGLAFTGLSALMLFALRRKRSLPSI